MLSQQGWTWQSADRSFKNKKYAKCMEQTLYFSVSVSQRAKPLFETKSQGALSTPRFRSSTVQRYA